jgi:hypothetical protein
MIGEKDSLAGYIKTIVKTITDKIGEVDSRFKRMSKYLTDSTGLKETRSRIHIMIRSATDKIGEVESKISSRYHLIVRVVTDKLGGLESSIATWIRPSIQWIREVTESMSMKEKYNRLKNWYRKWHKERPRQRVGRE